ncbi:hypothetical protein P3T76_003003 [Phytophthora citrophthora]|uniref:Uncharacterized protein n=1 Tax=Phytophthora citrophthora TaxID=4793 RepID=A0AAD9GVV8_9STRA|nr:hypothetical protein P3T76_003003 [Phytophthora citrophthora]
MKTFLAIVAAFAFVGTLAAAEEPAVKPEVVPDSIEDDSPDNQEYYGGGGFRGYGGGYGYRRGWGGGYRRYGYRDW